MTACVLLYYVFISIFFDPIEFCPLALAIKGWSQCKIVGSDFTCEIGITFRTLHALRFNTKIHFVKYLSAEVSIP